MEGEFVGVVLGGCVLMTILFTILKFTETVAWSWLWILSPVWIPCCMLLGLIGMLVVMVSNRPVYVINLNETAAEEEDDS